MVDHLSVRRGEGEGRKYPHASASFIVAQPLPTLVRDAASERYLFPFMGLNFGSLDLAGIISYGG